MSILISPISYFRQSYVFSLLILGEGDAYEVEGSMAIVMETDVATEFHIYYFKDGLYEEKM